jgi:ribosome-associated toxin RatA of RatAB toxin-antitoxin module
VSHFFKELKVPYSAEQMFDLVVEIESYPKFLPWCSASQVFKQTDHELDGSLTIAYKSFSQAFRTHNHHTRPHEMQMRLIDGPFTHFCGHWKFTPLKPNGSLISFELHYTFKNMLLKMAVGAVFENIAKSIIHSFIEEANRRYSNQSN